MTLSFKLTPAQKKDAAKKVAEAAKKREVKAEVTHMFTMGDATDLSEQMPTGLTFGFMQNVELPYVGSAVSGKRTSVVSHQGLNDEPFAGDAAKLPIIGRDEVGYMYKKTTVEKARKAVGTLLQASEVPGSISGSFYSKRGAANLKKLRAKEAKGDASAKKS